MKNLGRSALAFLIFEAFAAPGCGAATAPGPRYLALASRDWLIEQVGQYDPANGWIRSDTYFDRPLQGTVYTLFGLAGKLAEVKTVDPMRIYHGGVPWEWSAHISPWPWTSQQQVLAIKGSYPTAERLAAALPLDDAHAVSVTAEFLKHRHLDVPQPSLTQVLTIDLVGDGRPVLLVCAHSDTSALSQDAAAAVYAVVLISFQRDGKEVTQPLRAYTAFKPLHRSLEEQEKFYGPRPFYRLIAFPDITGDGHLDIVSTKNIGHIPPVQIDEFDGKTVHKRLHSYTIE